MDCKLRRQFLFANDRNVRLISTNKSKVCWVFDPHLDQGCPAHPWLTGLRHPALYKEVGADGSQYEVRLSRTPQCTNPKPDQIEGRRK
jgi:hypothetical protein